MRKPKPIIRCSELDRILSCNGSLTLSRLLPKRPSGPEALEGQALHYLAHSRIRDELGGTGELGPTPEMPRSIGFSHWIADFYVREVRENVPPSWSLEMEMELRYEFDNFILTGHPDDIATSPDGTEVIGFDLKAGYIPVDPADSNWQVMGYGVLLKLLDPALRKLTYKIVQPRNDEDEGFERVSTVIAQPNEKDEDPLATWALVLELEINKAIANGMETDSSASACRWCPVPLLKCPSLLKELEYMKATLTPEFLAAIKDAPDDATLADLIITARTLAKPIEDATDLLHERLDRVEEVTAGCGKTIRRKTQRGSISYPDPVAYMNNLRLVLVEDDRIARCVKPSKSKVIEEIADRNGIPKVSKDKASATAVYDAHLAPLTEQGEKHILVIS